MTPIQELIQTLLRAWIRGSRFSRIAILLAGLLLLAWGILFLLKYFSLLGDTVSGYGPIFLIPIFVLMQVVASYEKLLDDKQFRSKIETFERQVREHPKEPQLAWELAQAKLESYLNRNLGQVRSIFWLTLVVMGIGLGFIMWGVYRAFELPDRLPVAVVASASGVLVSFIGGSFLIIYKSTLAQSRGYVGVLERINAVGMAVQILDTIPEGDAELKNKTIAEISKQLLLLYASDYSGTADKE